MTNRSAALLRRHRGLGGHPGCQLVGPSTINRKATTAAVPTTRPGAQRTVAVRPWRITATTAIGHSASAPVHESAWQPISRSPGRRQCTREYKIEPIHREIRSLSGFRKGQHAKGRYMVHQWLGIAWDESQRMSDNRGWIENHYPLIDRRMTREDALRWMDIETSEFPLPKRAACVGCPFHNASVWVELDALVPDETDMAAAVEKTMIRATGTEQYLHRRTIPLRVAIEEDRLTLAVVGGGGQRN